MTRKYSTKRALIASALSLALCFSMLIGTTFAWFTDSAVSAGNIIQTGNLDIEMYWADGTADVPGADSDDWKDASSGAIFDYALWEPGYTEVRHIKIENKGSLALKYTVNIGAEGQVDALSDVIDVYYLDPAAQIATADALTDANKLGTLTEVLAGLGESGYGELESGKADTITLALKMQETAGNEYQNNKIGASFTIQVLATQLASENDSFGNQYDKDAMILAKNAAEAQAALDEATPGATIYLASGNYGTLTFRQNADKKVVDITDMGGDAAGNEKYSSYKNITILGSAGAVVDQIDFQVGWVDDRIGASFVDIENLTVKGVTFSGAKTAINLEGSKGSALGINGLNIVDCKMTDDGNNRLVFQQITGYKDLVDKATGEYVMTAGVKNLTITGCEVTGAYMVIESRAMENLTITNNTFNGIKERDMLITSDTTNHPNVTYTGAITITGNTSTAGEERFIRASLNNSSATVVIKDNTIINYLGADADYIKVTDGNATIENNTLVSVGVKDAAAAQKALDGATVGTTIQLQPDVNYGKLYFKANPGHSNTTEVDIADAWSHNYVRSIENVTILGAVGAKVDAIVFSTGAQPGDCNNTVNIKNLVVDGVEFTDALPVSAAGYNAPIMITTSNATIDGLTVKNCKLIGNNSKLNLVYLYGADGSKNVTLANNTVDGIARLCELRGTENVTIIGNTIKNTYEHGILLAGGNYSGNVTITDNTADGINERFVRMAGAGDAVVEIKNNTIINYLGADDDYIKVTGGNNVTIENNTMN